MPEDALDRGASGRLARILVRIPLFENLVPSDCMKIIAQCERARFAAKQEIYGAGDPGNEMLILLGGSVKITMDDGTEVAEVTAPNTVGEMEIATSMPRMASVVAGDTEVTGLTLNRLGLEKLFHNDPNLSIKILCNILEDVAMKVASTDRKLAARISNDTRRK